ncbi:MAG: glycosyltransferase 87 family protein [Solirubrobacteraceae bacterium]
MLRSAYAGTSPRRPRSSLTVAVAVALLAAVVLLAVHRSTPLAFPRAAAIRLAAQKLTVGHVGSAPRWDSADVQPLDSHEVRVSLFAGGRIVAQDVIDARGHVSDSADFTNVAVPYGDWIAYQPAVLVLLSALFALVCGVSPWRRLRNLDVAAALSLSIPVVLFQRRYVDLSVLSALPSMIYLMVRCGRLGFGPGRAPVSTAATSTPLLQVVLRGWDVARRVRLLRIVLLALGLAFVMVGVSSPVPVDVAYAVMEGATKLLGGVLPYGHLPGDVVHGDTYPLLSYALYTPLAAVHPVHSLWDSVDIVLGATVVAALGAAWATFRALAGGRAMGDGTRPTRTLQAQERGLRGALMLLAFPPVLITVSTGTTDVPLAAMLAAAVLVYRRPAISGALLATAGWFKLAPFALVPVWLAGRRGTSLRLSIAAMIAVSLPVLVLLLALGGSGGPGAMVHAIEFQFSRGSPQSVWAALSLTGLQPIAEACVLGLIAGAVVRLRRDPALADSRPRIAAISACILLALQLSANYWAFLYLVWVVPLLAMALLGDEPTTEAAVPAPSQRSAAGELVGAGTR